jgi:hypothetical protein
VRGGGRDPRSRAAVINHMQDRVQYATQRCCLSGQLKKGAPRKMVKAIIREWVLMANKRYRAASLGLLTLARLAVARIWAARPLESLAQALLAEPGGVTTSGKQLWDKGLIRQLMVGIKTVAETRQGTPSQLSLRFISR